MSVEILIVLIGNLRDCTDNDTSPEERDPKNEDFTFAAHTKSRIGNA